MSQPSRWPLPDGSVRFVVPRSTQAAMAHDPLCQDLYPIGMGHYRNAAGHAMQRNRHDDHLLLYCTAGEGEITTASTDSKAHRVSAGDVVLLPAGLAHRYHASQRAPWTVYWTHFLGSNAPQFMALLQQHTDVRANPRLQVGVHPSLIAAFERLLEARNGSLSQARQLDACCRLRLILSELGQRLPAAFQSAGRGAVDIARIDAVMQAHLDKPLTLDTLSAQCNVSRFHLVKRYRALTGITPMKRFTEMKMARGCHLLDTSTQSIREVASAIGIEDSCYFSRSFKRVMGISPTEYRTRNRALS